MNGLTSVITVWPQHTRRYVVDILRGMAASGRSSRGGRRRWAVTGSNRRPSACKADALPAELTARAWYTVHVTYPSKAKRQVVLERLRQICLALPETSERPSHGAPSFFVREQKCFLMLPADHHRDGRF